MRTRTFSHRVRETKVGECMKTGKNYTLIIHVCHTGIDGTSKVMSCALPISHDCVLAYLLILTAANFLIKEIFPTSLGTRYLYFYLLTPTLLCRFYGHFLGQTDQRVAIQPVSSVVAQQKPVLNRVN